MGRLKDSPSDDISSSSSSEFIHSGEETSVVEQDTLLSWSAPVRYPTPPSLFWPSPLVSPLQLRHGMCSRHWQKEAQASCHRQREIGVRQFKLHPKILQEASLAQLYASLLHTTGCASPLHCNYSWCPKLLQRELFNTHQKLSWYSLTYSQSSITHRLW